MVSFFAPLFIAPWKSKPHPYHPVPLPDEETLLTSPESKEANSLTSSKPTFFFDVSFWLTALAILSIAITIWNLFVVQLRVQESHAGYIVASIGSPYNGLERLIRNESSPSWPLSSTHFPDFIGATEGNAVHHVLSDNSIVRLDSERTIIIQHRIRDYGLEYCAVKLEFSHSSGNGHDRVARAYGHIGEGPYLTLWRLEESELKVVLAPSSLPTSLLSRREFLGNITLDGMNFVQSQFFDCRSGSIQTLEIAVACMSDPCIMEFQLTQSPYRQGFWVVQSEQKPTAT